MNSATKGTPAGDFEAKAGIPVAEIAAAAKKAKKSAGKDSTYAISQGSKTHSTIYEDWATGKNGSAYVFTADMDIDCDGIDYKCKGNGDGQAQTDYGALAAYEVPWIVIPESFVNSHSSMVGANQLVATICDGKMYYGIFGDSNGDSPEVIGEASWLMGKTCFPTGDISGANGHGAADVTYIVFTGKDMRLPSSAVTKNYVTNFNTLKSMGDEAITGLTKFLGLEDKSDTTTGGSNSTTTGDEDTC
jgi:chitosanase